MTRQVAVGLCLSGAALSIASAGSPTPSVAPPPRTVAVVYAFVGAFAQGTGRFAWLRGPKTCPQAEVLDLRTRRRTRISSPKGLQCRGVESFGVLVFDGNRVLWQGASGWGLSETSTVLVSAALNDRRTRVVGSANLEKTHTVLDETYPPFPMAGASGRLIYYIRCDAGDCRRHVSQVRRIVAGTSRRLFEARRPVGLALSGTRLTVLEDRLGCCNYLPSWSPDGRRIAWIHDGSLVAANADGSHLMVLAPGTGGEYVEDRSDWSPDGSRLIFTYRSEAGNWVGIVQADGSGLGRLGSGSDPDWSPSGARIAFVRGDDVYSMNPDGSQERRLTTDAVVRTSGPTWSPDGTKLLVERRGRLYLIDPLAGGATVLPALVEAGAGTLAWSPDGTRIAFTAYDKARGTTAIAVMNADGTGAHELTRPNSGGDTNPVWSSDGGRIAFDRLWENGNGGSSVMVVNSDGTGSHAVSSNISASGAVWAPGRAALAWGDRPYEPTYRTGGLFVANADGTGRVRIAGRDEARVEIRGAGSGALRRSFTAPGTALALASSARHVAVLVQDGSRLELRRFRANGSALGGSTVPSTVSRYYFSLGSRTIVYATRGRVFATDAETGKMTVVAKTKAPPVGVSILGRRIVWAENVKRNRALIRAVVLPRH